MYVCTKSVKILGRYFLERINENTLISTKLIQQITINISNKSSILLIIIIKVKGVYDQLPRPCYSYGRKPHVI